MLNQYAKVEPRVGLKVRQQTTKLMLDSGSQLMILKSKKILKLRIWKEKFNQQFRLNYKSLVAAQDKPLTQLHQKMN